MALVSAVTVRKSYDTPAGAMTVLAEVSIEVDAGQLLLIYGASGSGKSTLLHILGGLDRPTAGDVQCDGRSLYAMDEGERAAHRNRTMGFIFQFYHLVPELTALENVILPGILGGRSRREAATRARETLARVGMSDRADHLPRALSGGEQQRVAIARALVQTPRLLLADEPTGNLDVERGREIMQLLREAQRANGMAVIMVTHNRELAAPGDRLAVLREGRLHAA